MVVVCRAANGKAAAMSGCAMQSIRSMWRETTKVHVIDQELDVSNKVYDYDREMYNDVPPMLDIISEDIRSTPSSLEREILTGFGPLKSFNH